MSLNNIQPVTYKVKIPDGAGGWQSYQLPRAGVYVTPALGGYAMGNQMTLLSLLNAIWGEIVAKGQGVPDTPVSGTGNGEFGLV